MAVTASGPNEATDSSLSNLNEDMESKGNTETVNEGWADAMARILNKQLPEGKLPVLAKDKRIEKRKAEKKEDRASKRMKSQERQAMLNKDRVKPDGSTVDYERTLAGIATRGVVKLFNAVSKHQKEMESRLKVAPTEAKKSKVVDSMSKSAFLDMLKSSTDKPKNKEQPDIKTSDFADAKSISSSTWSILRDDFMMGAKMRDWNRDEHQTAKEKDNDTEITEHSESDDDSSSIED
ncbi:RRP15-like protein isoform X1 [Montipora foliosa]|uniref:RRP15-like protein isoform X1 n=2 Tax=Montipora foliosa TaxID=591990 RepID=UPI0035F104D9